MTDWTDEMERDATTANLAEFLYEITDNRRVAERLAGRLVDWALGDD